MHVVGSTQFDVSRWVHTALSALCRCMSYMSSEYEFELLRSKMRQFWINIKCIKV